MTANVFIIGIGAIILTIVVIGVILWRMRQLRESFAVEVDLFASNSLLHERWVEQLGQSFRLRALPDEPWEKLRLIMQDYGGDLKTLTPSEKVALVCDPFDAKMYFPDHKVLASSPKGYFIALYDPLKAFSQECGYNFDGKTIGVLDRSSELFVKAVLHGYRIRGNVVKVPLEDWPRLDQVMENYDAIVTFVIPGSPLLQMLQTQNVSVMGFNTLDIDRVRLFYPFVDMEELDLGSLFYLANQQGGVKILAREKMSRCPVMRMKMIRIKPHRENFITRLQTSPEALDPTYRCYGDDSVNSKAECDSKYDVIGLPKSCPLTVWDQPCRKNEDCPFFKKNTNYNNSRGGCLDGGVCEMPVGMKRIGYRKYDRSDRFAPFCYGCDPKEPGCCATQIWPDYAFSYDQPQREKSGIETSIPMK